MCGIAGIVRPAPDAGDEERVAAMTATLVHRGPDGHGLRRAGAAVFGHRRLAIVDLSERGAQPMAAAEGRALISYNGEVFNHRALRAELEAAGQDFQSESDTEVVLRGWLEWGAAVVPRLNGMFAIALWDERTQTLLLARDRFGQKPLYYARLPDGGLAFASELRALAPLLRPALDRAAIAKYLCFDGFPAACSVYAGVEKLRPGHTLRWSAGEGAPAPHLVRYWSRPYGPDPGAAAPPRPAAAAGRLWELLVASVERRLMSDVPLGVFLSGGVDSSAVLAAMVERCDPRQVQTFAIGFREAGYDESEPAARVAAAFGVRHRTRMLDGEALLELLPRLLDHLDEPLADASVIPTYALSRFAREEVTVALGGDGGDELFAGYDTVVAERLARAFLRAPAPLRAGVARLVGALPPSNDKRSLQLRARRFVRGLDDPDPLARNQRWFGSFLPEEAAALVKGAPSPARLYEDLRDLAAPPGEQGPLELWAGIYLPDCVLTKVDRASMAVSLEVRAPFLDPELAEFVAGLPYRYKLRGLRRKWILKRALRGRLPAWVMRRSKQGFGAPCGEWLRGPLRAEAERLFDPARLAREDLLEPAPVARLWGEHLSGRHDHRKELWALYVLLRWLERRSPAT
ncbi:MAG: asparagine synthase (glutamine-hydrolyzing) [Planctomycetota bacterium]